jgi:hypothetical protein
MQILQGSRDFSRVETGILLRDAFARARLQSAEEFTSTAVLHAQVQIVFRLERVVEGDDEGVIAGGQDLLFCECSLDLVPLNHFLLAEHCTDC